MPLKFSFFRKPLFLLIVGLILTIGGFIFILQSPYFPFRKIFNGATPISKPTSVKLRTINGTITGVRDTNISVKDKEQTYNLFSKGVDIQKIISGTVAGGDAKTEPAKAEDLKIGQSVFVITEKNSLRVHSIYIIK